MTMINTLTIVGRVTKDPELRQAGEKNVCKFSVAVDQRAKRKGDQDKTDFFDIELWDKQAEFAQQFVSKGQMVAVTGRHESRKHDGKTYWTVKAETLDPFIGGKSESAPAPSQDYGF